MQEGSYQVIEGDATNPQAFTAGTPIVIPHVCNNIGAWGAGFVMAINRNLGEEANKAYLAWHERSGDKKFSYYHQFPTNVEIDYCNKKVPFGLGRTQFVHVGRSICIANMVAQHQTRGPQFGESSRPPIRYAALMQCMHSVLTKHRKTRGWVNGDPFEIHCPFFGSDLAGGSWDEIEKMIQEIWSDNGIHVVAYKYVPDEA